MSAAAGPSFALRHACVLEQDGGFSGEQDVVVEGGIVTEVGTGLTVPEARRSTT